MSRPTAQAAALLTAALGLAGCAGREPSSPPPSPQPWLRDVSAAAGVRFRHHNGASDRRLLPETMGAGVAVFDFDGDGWPDIFFVDSGSLPADDPGWQGGTLYRNLGEGHFALVEASGLTVGAGFYGLGVAVGDGEGDGDLDLVLTGIGAPRRFENHGDGSFALAQTLTAPADAFDSSAAFLDADRDGRLDLAVAGYVRWTLAGDRACRPDGVHRAYCTPEAYAGQPSRLYRNAGGGRLVEASGGLGTEPGKGLGLVALDLEDDGDIDLVQANDTERNFLFRNQGDGTFRESAVAAGLAFSPSGATRGGMGIDAGDLDGDGLPELVIGNFAQEMSALYRGLPAGHEGPLFADEAAERGLGLPTLLTLAFGTLVVDLDGDGWLDVALANGHIEPEISQIRRGQAYAQPLQLFRNDGQGRLRPLVPRGSDDPLAATYVGRGLATGDLDRDGDLDLVLSENGRAGHLLRNEAAGGHWLRLELRDRGTGASPYGARVVVEAGGRRLARDLAGGRSYLSTSEPVLTLGLGAAERVERLLVIWPSGRRRAWQGLAVDRSYRLEE